MHCDAPIVFMCVVYVGVTALCVMMADVDTLLDFDSPSLSSSHQTATNDDVVTLMHDPFSDNYQVERL